MKNVDISSVYLCVFTDSPAVPVSATSKELFRGFSYIAPTLDDVSAIVTIYISQLLYIALQGTESLFLAFANYNCYKGWGTMRLDGFPGMKEVMRCNRK